MGSPEIQCFGIAQEIISQWEKQPAGWGKTSSLTTLQTWNSISKVDTELQKTNTKRPTSSSQQMGWWTEQGFLCFLQLQCSQPSHIFLGLVFPLPCILYHCGLERFETVSRARLLTLTLSLPRAVTLVTKVTKAPHYCREAVWSVCTSAWCLLLTSENASSMLS